MKCHFRDWKHIKSSIGILIDPSIAQSAVDGTDSRIDSKKHTAVKKTNIKNMLDKTDLYMTDIYNMMVESLPSPSSAHENQVDETLRMQGAVADKTIESTYGL